MASDKEKRISASTDEQGSQNGFADAPQPALKGAPLSGSIADWAEQISQEVSIVEAEDAKALSNSPEKKKKRKSPDTATSRTSRGTSIARPASAKERAAAGLNPVSGLDIPLEQAGEIIDSGATATVKALSDLIESGNPLFKNGKLWKFSIYCLLMGLFTLIYFR